MLWPWPLRFDLECLQRIASDMMKLCIERNRVICGGVIAILVFDHMTFNIALRVALGSGIIFTKFDLRQLIRARIIAFLMLIRYITLWPWPLTRWPWKFVVYQPPCDQILYKIWEKSRNLQLNYWYFCDFLHTLCHAVTLAFDRLILNFYSTSGVMRLNSVQKLSEIE